METAPAIKEPPLFDATLLLYHWYPVIDPLPAVAAIDRVVAVAFRQSVCAAVDGWVVKDGKALTVIAPDTFDVTVQPFELVTIQ